MTDLSKLTVARLKALCKDRGLKNYSKLSKAALLEKLGAVAVVAGDNIKPPHAANIANKGKTALAIPEESDCTKSGGDTILAAKPLSSKESNSEHHSQENSQVSCFVSHAAEDPSKMNRSPILRGSKRFLNSEALVNPIKSQKINLRSTASGNIHNVVDLGMAHQELAPTSTHCDDTPGMQARPTPHQHVCPHSASISSKLDESLNSNNFSDLLSSANLVPKTGALSSRKSPGTHLQDAQDGDRFCRVPPQTRPPGNSGLNTQTLWSNVKMHPPYHHATSYHPPPSIKPSSPPCRTDQYLVPHSPLNQSVALQVNVVSRSAEDIILQSLRHISIPPSLNQRKLLPMISLSLIALDDTQRESCVRVSRMFRYAVYVSAQDILNRRFAGERLSYLIGNLASRGLSLNMTNMWPYLRLRQRELSEKQEIYKGSWVPRFYCELPGPPMAPIAERIYRCPDSDQQFLVAFRFVQTRICFALAHRELMDVIFKWVSSIVVDAREVLENEIWCITVALPDTKGTNTDFTETFYVLYETCEVIGRPPQPTLPALFTVGGSRGDNCVDQNGMSQMVLRADWSSYIAQRLSSETRHLHASLIQRIHDTNSDDFDHGIAKVWLKQIGAQGEEGLVKKKVAERYILGCVLANSVSGEYRSTNQMALELAGVSDTIVTRRVEKLVEPRVNMFISERHNVESVHFMKPAGLHPDLALVQTVARQEGAFVLKENGMVVGEDEIVPEVWMKLLGCSETGVDCRN